MDYLEFQQVLREEVSKNFGKDYILDIKKVDKNNGVQETGLRIGKQGSNISPVIYFEQFYLRYLDGEKISELVKDMLEAYHSTTERREGFERFTLDFDTWKNRIVFRLVSQKMNEKKLCNIPHIPYLDLAIIFYMVYDNKEKMLESIRIDNATIKKWNVSTEKLYAIAKENTPRIFPSKIGDLNDIIWESLKKNNRESIKESFLKEDPFLVLTNSNGVNGASVLLYKNVLKNIAKELECDLYILPSSIHEVLILPSKKLYDKNMLTKMVCEINESQLEEEEVLSNHAYVYRWKEGILEL